MRKRSTKSENVYYEPAEDVETRFDTSNYKAERSLPIGKNKKKIGPMKDELGRRITKGFVGLRP